MTNVTKDAVDAVVYVVDDDPELCESVDWLLASIDIKPSSATAPTPSWPSIDGAIPPCIVLDVRMPQMSGTRSAGEAQRVRRRTWRSSSSRPTVISACLFDVAGRGARLPGEALRAPTPLDAVQAGVEEGEERFHQSRCAESRPIQGGFSDPAGAGDPRAGRRGPAEPEHRTPARYERQDRRRAPHPDQEQDRRRQHQHVGARHPALRRRMSTSTQ